MNNIAIRVLRFGWFLLFVWFGYQQLTNPGAWVDFLPAWTGYFPIPGEMLVQANGWLELIAATALALGLFVRPIAIILSLHLALIAWAAGGAIGVRDGVLAIMGIALALFEPDKWTIDFRVKNKN